MFHSQELEKEKKIERGGIIPTKEVKDLSNENYMIMKRKLKKKLEDERLSMLIELVS